MSRTFFASLGWLLTKIRVPLGWADQQIIAAAEWCFEKSRGSR